MFMPSVRRSAFFFALNFGLLIRLIGQIRTDFLSSRWEKNPRKSAQSAVYFVSPIKAATKNELPENRRP
jgi:hypothetical protein